MNVAFLNPMPGADWGGMENWMIRVAAGLRARGDRVLVLARPRGRWPAACAAAAVPFAPYGFGGDLHPFAVLALARHFRRHETEAVVVKGYRQARFARRARPRAAVVIKLPIRRDLGTSWFDRLTLRLCIDHILVDSHARRREFLEVPWLPPDKVTVVHNGIDVAACGPDPGARERVRALCGAAPDAVVVGGAGRFVPSKRYADAVRAFAASGHVANARLVLFGDGPEREAVGRAAAASGVADRILLAGWREDAADYARGFDILLHPSESEGFPNTVLEAMAAGIPPVATTAGGTPELVVQGESGLLADPGDVEGLARHLGDLVGDPARRARVGAAALSRVRGWFTLDRMTDGVRAVLVAAAEARRRRAPGRDA